MGSRCLVVSYAPLICTQRSCIESSCLTNYRANFNTGVLWIDRVHLGCWHNLSTMCACGITPLLVLFSLLRRIFSGLRFGNPRNLHAKRSIPPPEHRWRGSHHHHSQEYIRSIGSAIRALQVGVGKLQSSTSCFSRVLSNNRDSNTEVRTQYCTSLPYCTIGYCTAKCRVQYIKS